MTEATKVDRGRGAATVVHGTHTPRRNRPLAGAGMTDSRSAVPSELDAERHLIGALLLDPSKIGEVVQYVGAVDFYHPAHAAIFGAIDMLHEDGRPIDPVTVAVQMHTDGSHTMLKGLGGEAYLAELTSAVVTTENVAYYAKLVATAASRRRKLELYEEAKDALRRCDEDAERQVLDRIAGEQPKCTAPTAVRASSIAVGRIDWVWRGRIARAMMVLLDGDPGLGKSTVLADLAARVSRGEPLPGDTERSTPGAVVLISFEDSAAHVIVPRLSAASADLDRVHIWNTAAQPFTLPDSLGVLEKLITDVSAVLVIIDPFMAALSADVDAHYDADIRRVLAAVAVVAERTRAALLFVRHLNKTAGGKALYRGGGSIGIIGAARIGLLLEADPDDDEGRVLAVTKCNVGRLQRSLGLRLVAAPSPAPGIEVARVDWTGTVDATADDLLVDFEAQTATGEAVEVLQSILASGPVAAAEAQKQARAAGVSARTLQRAKKKLGIRSERQTPTGPWTWVLPNRGAK